MSSSEEEEESNNESEEESGSGSESGSDNDKEESESDKESDKESEKAPIESKNPVSYNPIQTLSSVFRDVNFLEDRIHNFIGRFATS